MIPIFPGGAMANLGDERYEVEWQEFTAAAQRRSDADPNYETDMDRDVVSVYKVFPKSEEKKAEAFAKRMARTKAYFSTATISLQRVDLMDAPYHVGEWVDVETKVIAR